jgi:hypothetical protein
LFDELRTSRKLKELGGICYRLGYDFALSDSLLVAQCSEQSSTLRLLGP